MAQPHRGKLGGVCVNVPRVRYIANLKSGSELAAPAQGLPLETLQSLQALAQARREYLRTINDYNVAQFQLQRALGWSNGTPAK